MADRQGFNSVGFLIQTSGGTTTGNIKILESDDNVTFTEAPENVVYGDGIGVITVDGKFKAGYTGYKRYTKVQVEAGGDKDVYCATIMCEPNSAPVE